MLVLTRHGIVLTNREWFDVASRGGVRVFQFPGSPRGLSKLGRGSVCVVLIKGEWVFVGEFVVRGVRLISSSEYEGLRRKGLAYEPRGFRRRDEYWALFFDRLVVYPRPVPKSELRGVRTSTSKKPISEWVITGFSLIDDQALQGIRERAGRAVDTHSELVSAISYIGRVLGYRVEEEVWDPQNVYRYDVAWYKPPAVAPIAVVEIVNKSDVDKALVRLKHAADIWMTKVLMLVVADERKLDRVKQLVHPRLAGAFHEIADRLILLSSETAYELRDFLARHEDLLAKLLPK